jgi:hypothetical protein
MNFLIAIAQTLTRLGSHRDAKNLREFAAYYTRLRESARAVLDNDTDEARARLREALGGLE